MIACARVCRCVLVAFALLIAAAASARAQAQPSSYDDCTALVKSEPSSALANAALWADKGGGAAAKHCWALAQAALSEFGEAAKLLTALAADIEPLDTAVAAQLYAQAGDAWLRAGAIDPALAALDNAVRGAPESVTPLVNRARAYAEDDNYWAALDDLSRAADLAPTRDEIYVLRAAAYRQIGSFELAADDVTRALRINPRNPDALVEMGVVKLANDDIAGAQDAFGTAILVSPESPAAWLARDFLVAMRQDITP